MDKQHSDHIEHRIRQATENITPPFKEEGWQKMEVLLDNEFNKKRRRGFIWWWYGLFVCLIIGGGFYYFNSTDSGASKRNDISSNVGGSDQSNYGISSESQPAANAKAVVPKMSNQQEIIVPQPLDEKKNINQGDKENKVLSGMLGNKLAAADGLSLKTSEKKKPANVGQTYTDKTSKLKPGRKRMRNNSPAHLSSAGETLVKSHGGQKTNDKASGTNKNQSLDANKNLTVDSSNQKDFNRKNNKSEIQASTAVATDSAAKADVTQKNDTALNTTAVVKSDSISATPNKTGKKALKKAQSIAQPGLYFMASVASDGSDVKKFTLDNRKPVYGIGLGYRFNNRMSVQTGFYAGTKIYFAGPTDYKVNPDSYIGRMKILKVDADCLIYELPLSLRYDVVAHENFRAYAVAGLSSFIMKRENYKYHLMGSMGYVSKDSTYTSNKNFFSSAGLSIGFEQKLSRSFYIQAEPYIKIPMSGIGEGKVKLYSAGLQFGIKYQPIKRTRKHK